MQPLDTYYGAQQITPLESAPDSGSYMYAWISPIFPLTRDTGQPITVLKIPKVKSVRQIGHWSVVINK